MNFFTVFKITKRANIAVFFRVLPTLTFKSASSCYSLLDRFEIKNPSNSCRNMELREIYFPVLKTARRSNHTFFWRFSPFELPKSFLAAD